MTLGWRLGCFFIYRLRGDEENVPVQFPDPEMAPSCLVLSPGPPGVSCSCGGFVPQDCCFEMAVVEVVVSRAQSGSQLMAAVLDAGCRMFAPALVFQPACFEDQLETKQPREGVGLDSESELHLRRGFPRG